MFLSKTHSLSAIALALLLPMAYGYDDHKPYAEGRIVDVEKKSREKVDMYLVNTPVTTPVPYFQLSLDLGEMEYKAEYTPRHTGEELPEAWRAGETVSCRVYKHRLYLRRPDGTDMPWNITKKTTIDKSKSSY